MTANIDLEIPGYSLSQRRGTYVLFLYVFDVRKLGYFSRSSENWATHSNSRTADIFSHTRRTSFLPKNTPPPFFFARCGRSRVRKLNNIAESRCFFIFGCSREFRKNCVLSNFLWLMDSDSYDQFCMWIEEPKRGDLLTKAFPSFEDGKIYLKV